VGQTWTQDGVSLTLDDVMLTLNSGNAAPAELGVSFVFQNNLATPVLFALTPRNFFYADNQGHKGNAKGWGWSCYDNKWQVQVAPGSTLKTIDCTYNGSISEDYRDRLIWFNVDITDQSITEVTITVDGFSRISNVSWRINIPH
jgi:hypothetical protein